MNTQRQLYYLSWYIYSLENDSIWCNCSRIEEKDRVVGYGGHLKRGNGN